MSERTLHTLVENFIGAADAAPAEQCQSRFDRMIARYRADHRHPVNNLLHVTAGWPMVAAALLLVPFRPWWSVGLFGTGYALMFTGHFVFERNVPTILKHPTAPFHVGRAIVQGVLRGIRPRRR